MCGIAGYFAFGSKVPDKIVLNNILEEMESRGTDATGISYLDKSNNLVVIKDNIKASNFIRMSRDWRNLTDIPKYMIMHTRYATKGSIMNSKNNHPIYRKGLAIVHNGVISNDDNLYDEYKFQRDGQVDSEIILALLEQDRSKDWKERTEMLNELNGSFAAAAIDNKLPNTLCLFRHTSPITFGIDKEDDILYFASTEKILKNAVTKDYRGICPIVGDLYYWDMPNNSGIVIGVNGKMDDFILDIKYNYTKYKHKEKESTSKNCSTCGKKTSCEMYNFTKGVVISCGEYIKVRELPPSSEADKCTTCKIKIACESPSTRFETLKPFMCAKMTTIPSIYCTDCVFSGCMFDASGHGNPAECDWFKYKDEETDLDKKCKLCASYDSCVEKFEVSSECSTFASKDKYNKEYCQYKDMCIVCEPSECIQPINL